MTSVLAESSIQEGSSTSTSQETSPVILPSTIGEPTPMPGTSLSLEDPFDDIYTIECNSDECDPLEGLASLKSLHIAVEQGFVTQEDEPTSSGACSGNYYADSEGSTNRIGEPLA